jgi:hypothetical protein
MLRCPSRTDLQELLAERLAAEQERPLLAHVETCSACQQALEELTAACAPGSAADGVVPPGEPLPERDSFWRALKAALPRWPPAEVTVSPAGLATGGKPGAAADTLPVSVRHDLPPANRPAPLYSNGRHSGREPGGPRVKRPWFQAGRTVLWVLPLWTPEVCLTARRSATQTLHREGFVR